MKAYRIPSDGLLPQPVKRRIKLLPTAVPCPQCGAGIGVRCSIKGPYHNARGIAWRAEKERRRKR